MGDQLKVQFLCSVSVGVCPLSWDWLVQCVIIHLNASQLNMPYTKFKKPLSNDEYPYGKLRVFFLQNVIL